MASAILAPAGPGDSEHPIPGVEASEPNLPPGPPSPLGPPPPPAMNPESSSDADQPELSTCVCEQFVELSCPEANIECEICHTRFHARCLEDPESISRLHCHKCEAMCGPSIRVQDTTPEKKVEPAEQPAEEEPQEEVWVDENEVLKEDGRNFILNLDTVDQEAESGVDRRTKKADLHFPSEFVRPILVSSVKWGSGSRSTLSALKAAKTQANFEVHLDFQTSRVPWKLLRFFTGHDDKDGKANPVALATVTLGGPQRRKNYRFMPLKDALRLDPGSFSPSLGEFRCHQSLQFFQTHSFEEINLAAIETSFWAQLVRGKLELFLISPEAPAYIAFSRTRQLEGSYDTMDFEDLIRHSVRITLLPGQVILVPDKFVMLTFALEPSLTLGAFFIVSQPLRLPKVRVKKPSPFIMATKEEEEKSGGQRTPSLKLTLPKPPEMSASSSSLLGSGTSSNNPDYDLTDQDSVRRILLKNKRPMTSLNDELGSVLASFGGKEEEEEDEDTGSSFTIDLSPSKRSKRARKPTKKMAASLASLASASAGGVGAKMREAYQDDEYVYPPLDFSDDEMKDSGGTIVEEKDTAWNPKNRVKMSGERKELPARHGAQRVEVLKSLKFSASSLKSKKQRGKLSKKGRAKKSTVVSAQPVINEIATTSSGPGGSLLSTPKLSISFNIPKGSSASKSSSSSTPSSSSATSVKKAKPTTVKQRLGKLLKLKF